DEQDRGERQAPARRASAALATGLARGRERGGARDRGTRGAHESLAVVGGAQDRLSIWEVSTTEWHTAPTRSCRSDEAICVTLLDDEGPGRRRGRRGRGIRGDRAAAGGVRAGGAGRRLEQARARRRRAARRG